MTDLRVGVVLDGYCGGWFGDSYGEKELIGVVEKNGDAVHVFRILSEAEPTYVALSRDDASQAHAAALHDERVYPPDHR